MERENIKSMNYLAREIGVSEASLSRIMNGKRNPGHKVIGKMLLYFGVSFERLFSFEGSLTKVNKSVEKVV